MSFLNCQFKWSLAFKVLMRENSLCKLLTVEYL